MEKYKTEIRWAVIFFAVTLIWMVIEKLSGLHSAYIDKHPIYTNLFAIPAIAVYVFALREKKRVQYSGTISYQQAFISGAVITLIVTVLSPVGQLITTFIISPEFFPNAIEYAVRSGNLTRPEAEKYFSLRSYLIQATIGAPVMGIITTAIVAIFVRTKQ